MPPVVGAIVGAVGAIVSTIGGIVSAVGAFTIGKIAVGRILLQIGLSFALQTLFAPKNARVGARQASTLELSLGETPRHAIFGRAATGGVLLNAWNDGADNDYETVVVKLADHEIDALEGYWVDDRFYAFEVEGEQTHDDFQDPDSGAKFWLQVRLGAPGQTVPSFLASEAVAAGEWSAEEVATSFIGFAYVVARYKVSDDVWTSGRPSFKWLVRGLKCYDPRLDDTVDGGEGAQRWGQPETYAWSDNAEVCRSNFIWGVWNYAADPAQLMVGPGKSFEEHPPEEQIAAMNLCDEDVALKAGGSEKRYRVSAAVAADEPWIDIEEHFAAAMAGQLVERGGSIGVDPGAAKSPVFAFSDDDLLSGADMSFQAETAGSERVNTVIARYVDPAQLWEEASAPMRRSQADIDSDGRAREKTLDLVFVTSQTQAQRIAEIERRKQRLMPIAVVPLGPKFMLIEDGDWGEWTSELQFDGNARTFEAQGVLNDEDGNVRLVLKEIAAAVYAWDPETDELDATNPAYLPPGDLPDAELADVAAEPAVRTEGSQQIPAIRVTWTPPGDASIKSVQIEWRQQGTTLTSSNTTADVAGGEFVIDSGLIGLSVYEVRAKPLTTPQRGEVFSDWIAVTTPEQSGGPETNFTAVHSDNMAIFGRSLRKTAALEAMAFDDDDAIEWDDDTPLEWDFEGWDGHVYSAEGYVGSATALAIVATTDKALLFGLSLAPAADDHFDNITAGWAIGDPLDIDAPADGKLRIFESGALVWDNDGDPEDAQVNDVLAIVYDGATISYLVSGVVKYTRDAPPDLRFYFDASFYSDGARLDGVAFAASASAGQVQETRYRRSVAPPATPSGAEPEGWSLSQPTGNEALWASTVTKTLAGALVSDWSTPALLTTPNWRGTYNAETTYYREDGVTYNGGAYRCIVDSVSGKAPSGTVQDNAWWVLISASPGAPPETPPAEFADTIAVPASSEGVNLYDLAVAAGYSGFGDADIVFEVADGIEVTGLAGAPDGGHAISTGAWPSGYTISLALDILSGAVVRGGGGKGGKGGDAQQGSQPQAGGGGGKGGDAIHCLAPIAIDIQSGAIVQGGGGAGGGGDGRYTAIGGAFQQRFGGGGGGGGQPNGPGGAGGVVTGGSDGAPGGAGSTAAQGAGGGSSGYNGRNGGVFGDDGAAADHSGAPGAGGYCVRKNGHTVPVTNNGTTAGTIG